MANLYEIDARIMECVDMETGEIIDPERLNALEMERAKKIESVALWYKNLIADAEAYKKEKSMFAQKELSAKNKAESLKRYLDSALHGDRFSSTKVSISYRKSEVVEIDSLDGIGDDYLRYKEPEPDKAALKAALKAGVAVEGVRLVANSNIQIK